MCGIFGIFNLDDGRGLDEGRFASALALLDHRGPDARQHQAVGDQVLLGHTRLSIIDVGERSHQPMAFGDRYWIIYNGEVFNYVELRRELEGFGRRFATSSDTEVVIQAYDQWGESCVERFNGMWAFAIYDRRERSLFCSRDRFGQKPFCYAIVDGQFLFASEIKAILGYRPDLNEPDYNSVSNYCRTSVGAQHEHTWFKLIKRLQPGHNLKISNGQVRLTRYWRYPNDPVETGGFAEAQEAYRALFEDSVRVRLRSDVPLGLTLSSGLDSSSIACAMHKLDPSPHHFFTSTFDPNEGLVGSGAIYKNVGAIDEAIGARQLAAELGQDFHTVVTDYTDIVGRLSKIINHLESGNSSPAVIPLMQLFAEARRHVTVVMEGQGADELLAGYVNTVLWPSILELVLAGKFQEAAQALKNFGADYSAIYSILSMMRQLSNRFNGISESYQRFTGVNRVFGDLLKNYSRTADYPALPGEGTRAPVVDILKGQHSGGLVNLLHYGDAISMAHGIESRMPFMDHRLVELVWSMPADHKIRCGVGKFLHREAMRGLVPDRIIDQRVKFGFNSPIGAQFIHTPGQASEAVEVLLSQRCLERGIFDRTGMRALLDQHQSKRRDHGSLLYRILSTELWFRTFVDEQASTVKAVGA